MNDQNAYMFTPPLVRGRLIKRYKRFLADIQLDTGPVVTAYCANTGAMTGLTTPGLSAWVQHRDPPAGRHAYTWEMIEDDGHFIGVDTHIPQKLFRCSWQMLSSLSAYQDLAAEVKVAHARLDFMFKNDHKRAYVEIKNVHWKQGDTALFPDTKSERATRHLSLLTQLAACGHEAMMIFIIQRADCARFRIAGHMDPALAHAFSKAQGVQFWAYTCHLSPTKITLGKNLPILDPFYGQPD